MNSQQQNKDQLSAMQKCKNTYQLQNETGSQWFSRFSSNFFYDFIHSLHIFLKNTNHSLEGIMLPGHILGNFFLFIPDQAIARTTSGVSGLHRHLSHQFIQATLRNENLWAEVHWTHHTALEWLTSFKIKSKFTSSALIRPDPILQQDLRNQSTMFCSYILHVISRMSTQHRQMTMNGA